MKRLIVEAMNTIVDSPTGYEPYYGNMAGISKYKFNSKDGVAYRIGFRLHPCCPRTPDTCPSDEAIEGECEGIVQFEFVLTRQDCDNLYKKDKDYFSQSSLDLELKEEKED
jgi:hypothetical protein